MKERVHMCEWMCWGQGHFLLLQLPLGGHQWEKLGTLLLLP
jgi:hypothetical protein